MVTHWIAAGRALCGAAAPITIGWEWDNGRDGDVTCQECLKYFAMRGAPQPVSSTSIETPVERATRLLRELLPTTRDRDQAMDSLYCCDPTASTAVRLASISAALYILREQRDDLATREPPDLVARVKEWQSASAHFRAVVDSSDIDAVSSALEWRIRAENAVKSWRPKRERS